MIGDNMQDQQASQDPQSQHQLAIKALHAELGEAQRTHGPQSPEALRIGRKLARLYGC